MTMQSGTAATASTTATKRTPENDAERLRADIDALRSDFAAAVSTFKGMTSHTVEEAIAKGKHVAETAGEQAKEVRDSIEDQIRAKPLQALAIAFFAGIVLALLRNR